MTDVFTSHWRNAELADLDCVPVGISRGEPRWKLGFRYRRYPVLAPDGLTWTQEDLGKFAASYVRQLEALGAGRILSDLERIADGKAAVMLCWEKLADPDEYCHRRTLAGFLEREAGIQVPELRPGDVPRRPDSPQVSLFEGYREDRK